MGRKQRPAIFDELLVGFRETVRRFDTGIGRALALKLASEGAAVVVNDLDAAPAEQTVADIRAAADIVAGLKQLKPADLPCAPSQRHQGQVDQQIPRRMGCA